MNWPRILVLCSIVLMLAGLIGIGRAAIFTHSGVLLGISAIVTIAGIWGISIWGWREEPPSD
jgi:hypothetical protein